MGSASSVGTSSEYDGSEDRRYPVVLDLEYRICEVRAPGTNKAGSRGSGRTLSISSGGVLFEADQPLRAGLHVALSIAWPVSLSRSVGLTLMAAGYIVRADRDRATLKLERYEFRTRSVPPAPAQYRAEE